MIPLWLQWTSAILGPIGTFLTAAALVYTIRQRNEAKRSADETASGLQTVVQTFFDGQQLVVQRLLDLQQHQVDLSPWVKAAITAVLDSQLAVVTAAKPYTQRARGLSDILDRIGITNVSGGTSAEGPLLETVVGEAPPVPPGTFLVHPPKNDGDGKPSDA